MDFLKKMVNDYNNKQETQQTDEKENTLFDKPIDL